MGNTHGRRSVQGKKLRKRPHSIAVEKPETWSSSKPQLLRSASHGSIRRRYSESGNYSYKTPWPVPLSEAVFLPEYDSKQPVKISDFEVCWQKYKFKIASGGYKHLNNERRSTHFQYNCLLVLGNVSLWILKVMAVFWKPRDFPKLETSKTEHGPHSSTFIFRQKIFVSIFCSNFANLQHIRYSFNSVKNHAAVPKSAVLNISIICHRKSLRFIR